MGGTLVVTDLDGTFWDRSMQLHPATVDAVAELDRLGVPLLIATGRRLATARAGFAEIDFWRPTIVLNGTLGVDYQAVPGRHIDEASADPASGSSGSSGAVTPSTDSSDGGGPDTPIFHRAPFPVGDAHAVIDAFARFGHNPCSYSGDGRVHVGPDATTGPRHRAEMATEIGSCDPRELADGGDVLGFSIIGVSLDGLDGLAPELQSLGLLVDVFQDPIYGGYSIMAQPPGVSKQSGIEAFIRYAGLDNPRVIAIGDGGNDIQMIESADIGVGVSDGDPAVLDIADETIGPPTEGGWAKVLDFVAS